MQKNLKKRISDHLILNCEYTPYKTNANIGFELLILYDLYLRNDKLYPNNL
jgi:hypothetical protein